MPSTLDTILPILTDTYGEGGMVRALAEHLSVKIDRWDSPNPVQPTYGARDREDMVRQTCWDWFSGGTTAEGVARRIEEALVR